MACTCTSLHQCRECAGPSMEQLQQQLAAVTAERDEAQQNVREAVALAAKRWAASRPHPTKDDVIDVIRNGAPMAGLKDTHNRLYQLLANPSPAAEALLAELALLRAVANAALVIHDKSDALSGSGINDPAKRDAWSDACKAHDAALEAWRKAGQS